MSATKTPIVFPRAIRAGQPAIDDFSRAALQSALDAGELLYVTTLSGPVGTPGARESVKTRRGVAALQAMAPRFGMTVTVRPYIPGPARSSRTAPITDFAAYRNAKAVRA